jgi:hypothetical protein
MAPCLPAGRTGRQKRPLEGSSPRTTQKDERCKFVSQDEGAMASIFVSQDEGAMASI